MNRSFFGLPRGGNSGSCIELITSNGFGAISNKHRRFLTVVLNTGTDIIYEDSAAYGASFRIATAGRYAGVYCDSANAATNIGISRNSINGTTGVGTIPALERLCTITSAGANYAGLPSFVRWLPAGTIIRPHSDGLPVGSPDNSQFIITKLS
jgi:hypothetical protein